ncbi:MAG: hypothetical protein ABI867_18140 [Kofleriaceae bacterium]
MWRAIAKAHRQGFRIIESNHLHLIIEARDCASQARGVQGLKVSLTKGVNRALGRSGALFEERYHVRILKTPRAVRNALRYLLNNARHHAHERGELLSPDLIDPYSSAIWFAGWRRDLVIDALWKEELRAMNPSTLPATVWLLTTGWRRHGTIGIDEIRGVASVRGAKKW